MRTIAFLLTHCVIRLARAAKRDQHRGARSVAFNSKRTRSFWVILPAIVLAGCDAGSNPNDTISGAPAAGAPAAPPPAKASEIGPIMTKLAKGPSALTAVIGNELNTDPPPWEQLTTQMSEYVRLVGEM